MVRNLLKDQSIRRKREPRIACALESSPRSIEGKIYDEEGPAVVDRINTFVKTYEISFEELLIQDPKGYQYVTRKLCGFILNNIILSRTFNEFFYRKLKPNARPPASPTDPSVICSAADCRLMVFNDVTAARTFWFVGYFFHRSLLTLSQDQGEVFQYSFATRLPNPSASLYTTLLLSRFQISPAGLSCSVYWGEAVCVLMGVLRIIIGSTLRWTGQLKA